MLGSAFENETLGRLFRRKRHELIRDRRKLRNVEIHSLYSSSNISKGLDSSVTIVTRLRFGRPEESLFRSRQVHTICFLCETPRPRLGTTQPPVHWIPREPSHEVKRPRRETVLLTTSTSKIKN